MRFVINKHILTTMCEKPILINTTADAYFIDIYRPKNHPAYQSHEHSQLIDILRDKRQEKAIKHFADVLKPYIPEGIAITAVPPSVAVTHRSGIQLVVKILTSGKRIDSVDCLVRMKRIQPLREIENRPVETHLESIIIRQPERIRNFRMLLLDDIYNTGNSLKACKKMLLDAGAKEVRILALGLTWREDTEPQQGRLII
ncbi:MAG: phosphoribosyltransferase [candidate division Zixibacteria bacterium]|nr:phosphoribosyltransferase [candidate division Zixibacteria bacterium]